MALKEQIPFLMDYMKNQRDLLAHNNTLFNIFEGDLLTYVLEDLKKQLSPKAYEQITHRVAPINILKKMIDKLSKIYATSPNRDIGEIESDKDLLQEYEKAFEINTNMTLANEFFNLFKTCLIEPYLDTDGTPKLRTIPSDRFAVFSDDLVDPQRPTHVIKFMGKYKDKSIFYLYTDSEFLIVDEFGEIQTDRMTEINNPEGINIYGKIPCVYVNRSRHCLTPLPDTDTLRMAKLIPVLLSDLNYAVMYQSFSVIWTIDANTENLVQAPNALWNIKSDATSDKTPQIGSLKPTVDIDQVVGFIKDQISLWFTTRSIKPGAIGQMSPDEIASGVSKIIDQADTSEDRQKQIPYFVNAEEALWDLIINYMHPVWMSDKTFQLVGTFSPGAKVEVDFPAQKPMLDQSKTIVDMISLKRDGLITKEMALKNIFPDLPEEQIDEMLKELASENTVEIENPKPFEGMNGRQEVRPKDDSNS